MGLAAVQENRDCCYRDMGHRQGKQQDLPAGCVRDAVEQEIENEIQAGMLSHYFSMQFAIGTIVITPFSDCILRGFLPESPNFPLGLARNHCKSRDYGLP
jgi:hypothetical protein